MTQLIKEKIALAISEIYSEQVKLPIGEMHIPFQRAIGALQELESQLLTELQAVEADRDKTTWIKGAESTMPTMKDVVNKYIAWLDFSCHIHGDIVHFIGESTGLDTYTFFIDNIYKPNLEK